eukprot:CAMPEP_0178901640 /NCGR_PEP_ID=MMETSP0786-20121207/4148_1 /TAXON_ID=186022 /ORGANISM="Thalassionema frauenfeldii, Strain CCMP 1798" /LENGTH=286 /DNA_ID=CAMNT_0020572791 /DNA_START=108 /DNA_END=968 /DNA_ORIENTATION=+
MAESDELTDSGTPRTSQGKRGPFPNYFVFSYESDGANVEENNCMRQKIGDVCETNLDYSPNISHEHSRGLKLPILNNETEDPSKDSAALEDDVFFLYDEVGELALEDFDGDVDYEDVGWSAYDRECRKDSKRIRKDISRSISPKNSIISPHGVLQELDTSIEWNERQQQHRQTFSRLKTPKSKEGNEERLDQRSPKWIVWGRPSYCDTEKCDTLSFRNPAEIRLLDIPDSRSSQVLSQKNALEDSQEEKTLNQHSHWRSQQREKTRKQAFLYPIKNGILTSLAQNP